MMLVNASDLVEVFNQWARSLTPVSSDSDWVSIDGKYFQSTCINHNNQHQNFVSIVSLFSQTSGLVLRLQNFPNKKRSEIKRVQEQVLTEATKGQVFTLDALHGAKNKQLL